MNLEDLKNYQCEELRVFGQEISDGDTRWNIRWDKVFDPDSETFRIDFSKEGLADETIEIPTFMDDFLLPFRFVDTNRPEPEEYRGYSNYANFKVVYNRVHLVHITQEFGVRVMKKTDEKFLHPVITEKKDIYLRYHFEEKQWKQTTDLNGWEEEKEKVESFYDSEEWVELSQQFFLAVERLRRLKMTSEHHDFEVLRELQEQLSAELNLIEDYYQIKNLLREVSDTQMNYISKAIQHRRDSIAKAGEELNGELHECVSSTSVALGDMQSLLFTPGYWVHEGMIYPNIAEDLVLGQKADDNRNEETKHTLHQALLHHVHKEHQFVRLDDPRFQLSLSEFK